MRQHVPRRRVLKKVLEAAFERLSRRLLEGFLDLGGVLQWDLEGGRVFRRVSKKGMSRKHSEGRNTPF